MGKGVLRRTLRWFLGSRLRLVSLAYSTALTVFALLFCLYPSDLLAILGTLVFTVLATLLTALKFSKDLEKSTSNQINALRELSLSELNAAQSRNKESIEALRNATREQVNLLSDRFDRVIQTLSSISEALSKSAKEAEELRRKQEELLAEQQKAREKEEAHRQEERARLEQEALRRVPRLSIRIVERALPVLGFIRDFWLEVRNETSILELKVVGKSFSRVRNVYGTWQVWTGHNLGVRQSHACIKFGSIGVRNVHDTVEIHIEAVNREDERFARAFVMPLRLCDWTEVSLQRVA